MSDAPEEIKRWTARRKAAVVLEIIKGNTTAAEVARSHDLTVAEVGRGQEDFLNQGTEALRANPRGVEARHQSEKKELLAGVASAAVEYRINGVPLRQGYEGWAGQSLTGRPRNRDRGCCRR